MTPRRSDDRTDRKRVPQGSAAFRRSTELRRQMPNRVSWSTAIVTNGRCTEKVYFSALAKMPWVTTAVRVLYQSGSPYEVVKRARALRRDGGYDEVWAVCDVDEFKVEDAARMAEDCGVGFVLSNPCFEIWLILHLRDCRRPFAAAGQVGVHLKQLLATWDKTKLDFADFEAHVTDAVGRAKKLDAPPAGNPSTDVWRLVEALGREHSPE